MESNDLDGVVGLRFRQQREALGLSMDEISERTRIKKSFLAAIESGHYDEIPGETYLVGFMRGYAGALGLDGDEIVHSYRCASDSQAGQSEREQVSSPDDPPDRDAEKNVTFPAKGVLVILLLIVLAGGTFYWLTGGPSALVTEGSALQAPKLEKPPLQSVQSQEEQVPSDSALSAQVFDLTEE